MSNRTKTIIVFVLAWTLLIYLGTAFMQWSFDLSNMTQKNRGAISGIWIVISLIGSTAIYSIQED